MFPYRTRPFTLQHVGVSHANEFIEVKEQQYDSRDDTPEEQEADYSATTSSRDPFKKQQQEEEEESREEARDEDDENEFVQIFYDEQGHKHVFKTTKNGVRIHEEYLRNDNRHNQSSSTVSKNRMRNEEHEEDLQHTYYYDQDRNTFSSTRQMSHRTSRETQPRIERRSKSYSMETNDVSSTNDDGFMDIRDFNRSHPHRSENRLLNRIQNEIKADLERERTHKIESTKRPPPVTPVNSLEDDYLSYGGYNRVENSGRGKIYTEMYHRENERSERNERVTREPLYPSRRRQY